MENQQADTIIGVDVNVKGNLKNKGSIQVNGTVEGEIRSDENITVGETAVVNGPVVAKYVLISGRVNGTIDATDRLEIDPTGGVTGDIKAKSLIVREGAIFNGNCAMADSAKEKGKVETPSETKAEDVTKKDPTKAGFWDKGKK